MPLHADGSGRDTFIFLDPVNTHGKEKMKESRYFHPAETSSYRTVKLTGDANTSVDPQNMRFHHTLGYTGCVPKMFSRCDTCKLPPAMSNKSADLLAATRKQQKQRTYAFPAIGNRTKPTRIRFPRPSSATASIFSEDELILPPANKVVDQPVKSEKAQEPSTLAKTPVSPVKSSRSSSSDVIVLDQGQSRSLSAEPHSKSTTPNLALQPAIGYTGHLPRSYGVVGLPTYLLHSL